jgi:hypothetical protein
VEFWYRLDMIAFQFIRGSNNLVYDKSRTDTIVEDSSTASGSRLGLRRQRYHPDWSELEQHPLPTLGQTFSFFEVANNLPAGMGLIGAWGIFYLCLGVWDLQSLPLR